MWNSISRRRVRSPETSFRQRFRQTLRKGGHMGHQQAFAEQAHDAERMQDWSLDRNRMDRVVPAGKIARKPVQAAPVGTQFSLSDENVAAVDQDIAAFQKGTRPLA